MIDKQNKSPAERLKELNLFSVNLDFKSEGTYFYKMIKTKKEELQFLIREDLEKLVEKYRFLGCGKKVENSVINASIELHDSKHFYFLFETIETDDGDIRNLLKKDILKLVTKYEDMEDCQLLP